MLWRRLLYLGFLLVASLRMRWADRLPWADWLRYCLDACGCFDHRAERTIWIHGEGMGEFNAAGELIDALRQRHPDTRLIFSSSRAAICNWLARKHPRDLVLPPPWDIGFAIRNYLDRLSPRLIMLLEFHDGFCPGALEQARRRHIPVVVINARALHPLKPLRFKVAESLGLVQEATQWIDLFCVQDATSSMALARLGVPASRRCITGNLKYDAAATEGGVSNELLGIAAPGPVIVAGCIHAEEERIILDAFERLRSCHSDMLLVLAPHDLARVPAIRRDLKARTMSYALRSTGASHSHAAVLIVDRFGELASLYALATVVVMGGSFTRKQAGHSLAEPAKYGKPIVFGPHVCSQEAMVETFLAGAAAVQCSAARLATTLQDLLQSPERRGALGRNARAVVAASRGGTARTLTALASLISRPGTLPTNHGQASKALTALKNTAKSLAGTMPGQFLLSLRSRRIGSISELHRRLGDPHTILCLGNGPSSEDDRLHGLNHDCLFRVNWRWAERDFFTQPDVIFTGDRASLRRMPHAIFGLRTVAEETSILLNTFVDCRFQRTEYLTWERVCDNLDERRWGTRPTNGAVMIACAVALQPRRLIIAGIDLFQHPAGAYPGDTTNVNGYAPMHNPATELSILRHLLAQYRGELIIIGDILKRSLAA